MVGIWTFYRTGIGLYLFDAYSFRTDFEVAYFHPLILFARETGTYVLKGVDVIRAIQDDQITMKQAMKFMLVICQKIMMF